MASVPENAPSSDLARFLPPARKVCGYLEQVLLHCGSHPADSEEWLAAGMYVLMAFFLQNNKSTTPRFYCPPREYDPVRAKESTVVVPDVVMNPPEDEEIQFDFFLTMRKRYEEMYGKKAEEDSDGSESSADISLANIRQELRPFSAVFTIIDPEGMTTYAYLVVEYLSFEEGKWCLRNMLREIPYEMETPSAEGQGRKFLVNSTLFAGEKNCGLLITAAHDGSKAWVNAFVYTWDQRLYVSRESSDTSVVDIDENGHQRDSELEQLLDYCGVGGFALEPSTQPVKWKKAISDFDPAYLQYLILDVQGRKEIPKTISRDPLTGAYRIHATLPCPGKLITMEVTPIGESAESYAVAGYLHGAYGLKKDPQKAEKLMREGVENGDPAMAFEYGAFLRHKSKPAEAEKYLRQAAEADISGAQFELAELLKDRASPEDIAEARSLLDSLWEQGYRTYGQKSIDLWGEHS